jgi:uncharacterized membrane protein YfcA
VPIKAATATSGFLMGFTAVSGAIVFYINGYVDTGVMACMIPGTFVGAIVTTRFFPKVNSSKVYTGFTFFLMCIAIFMIYRGYRELYF